MSTETVITWSLPQRNVFAKEILALRTKYIFTFEVQAALSELIRNTQVHVFWSGFLLVFIQWMCYKVIFIVMLSVQIENYNCVFARAGLLDDGRC